MEKGTEIIVQPILGAIAADRRQQGLKVQDLGLKGRLRKTVLKPQYCRGCTGVEDTANSSVLQECI